MIGVEAWAASRGVAPRTARKWAADGSIIGAVKQGKTWLIPADAPAPYTTPAHMRPAARTITGEIVPTGNRPPVPARPVPALYTPEPSPLFYTFDQVAAMVRGVIEPRTLAVMLAAGEIPGALKRGKAVNGHATWIIPGATVKRLRGDDVR